MPEWFVEFAAVVGIFGGIFGTVNGYRSMKRSSPIEEVKKENIDKWSKFYTDKWDVTIERIGRIEETVKHVDSEKTRRHFAEIDEKLENDYRRIKLLSEANQNQQRFLILLLKAQQQTLAHLSDGNHKGNMKQISDEIQAFLLNEATKISDCG